MGVTRGSSNWTEHIPVLRPLLPPARAVAHYLTRIDNARIYSNFGPLASEFEFRLSNVFAVSPGATVATAPGTLGLIATILACARLESGRRSLAMMPAYSFAATAVAAERAGLKP